MTTLEKIRKEILNTFLWENETEENLNYIARKCLEIIDKYAEQEPCEDAISREAVLDELNKWEWQELYLPIHFKENIIDVVPSVRPQEPQTGHWIKKQSGVWTHNYECSECGGMVLACEVDLPDYCGHCGARMESEDADT